MTRDDIIGCVKCLLLALLSEQPLWPLGFHSDWYGVSPKD